MKVLARLLLAILIVTGSQPTTEDRIGELVEATREAARQVEGTDPDRPVTVTFVDEIEGTAHGKANYETSLVRVIEGGSEYTLVHEVAHILTPNDWHGATWCAVYLAAVNTVLTPSEYNATHCPYHQD